MALIQREARAKVGGFWRFRGGSGHGGEEERMAREALRLFAVGVRLGSFAVSEAQDDEYAVDLLRELACGRFAGLAGGADDPVRAAEASGTWSAGARLDALKVGHRKAVVARRKACDECAEEVLVPCELCCCLPCVYCHLAGKLDAQARAHRVELRERALVVEVRAHEPIPLYAVQNPVGGCLCNSLHCVAPRLCTACTGWARVRPVRLVVLLDGTDALSMHVLTLRNGRKRLHIRVEGRLLAVVDDATNADAFVQAVEERRSVAAAAAATSSDPLAAPNVFSPDDLASHRESLVAWNPRLVLGRLMQATQTSAADMVAMSRTFGQTCTRAAATPMRDDKTLLDAFDAVASMRVEAVPSNVLTALAVAMPVMEGDAVGVAEAHAVQAAPVQQRQAEDAMKREGY